MGGPLPVCLQAQRACPASRSVVRASGAPAAQEACVVGGVSNRQARRQGQPRQHCATVQNLQATLARRAERPVAWQAAAAQAAAAGAAGCARSCGTQPRQRGQQLLGVLTPRGSSATARQQEVAGVLASRAVPGKRKAMCTVWHAKQQAGHGPPGTGALGQHAAVAACSSERWDEPVQRPPAPRSCTSWVASLRRRSGKQTMAEVMCCVLA